MRYTRKARQRLERKRARRAKRQKIKNMIPNNKTITSSLLITSVISTSVANAATVDDLRELMGAQREDEKYTPEQQRQIIQDYTRIENNNRLAKILNVSNPVDINQEIQKEREKVEKDIEEQRNKLKQSFSTGVTIDSVLAEKTQLVNLKHTEQNMREEREFITLEIVQNVFEEEYRNVIRNIREVESYKEVGIIGTYLYSPVRNSFVMSSPFGYRTHPITGGYVRHNGIDLIAKEGTEIQAVWAGVVTETYYTETGGNTVVIEHDDGLETFYMHLNEVLVYPGQIVNQYDLIALSGGTGDVTGPHLHFEVKIDGEYVNPVFFFGEKGKNALENLIMGSEDPLYQAMAQIIPRIKSETKDRSTTEYIEPEHSYGKEFEPPSDSVRIILKEGHKMPNPSDDIK